MMTDIGDGSFPPETMTLGKEFIRSTQVTITAGPTQSGTGASAVKTEESTGDHQRWGLR